MISKNMDYGTEAREKLKQGVDKIANAVKVTLGPKGRAVIIERKNNYPIVTKDGVSVAKEVFLIDPVENMGAQMIKQVALNAAELAGDGTTTATVLAQAIITAGLKNVAAGANPLDLKKGIDQAVAAVVESLKEQSVPVDGDREMIKNVACISANNDLAIGELIVNAFEQVGNDGVITLEFSNGMETEVKVVEGMQFDKGFVSPHFATNYEKMLCEMPDAQVLISERNISSMRQLLPFLERRAMANMNHLPLLIICDELESDVFPSLLANRVKGSMKVCWVKCPSFGDGKRLMLEDIAILTGATVVSEGNQLDIENASVDILGSAEKIVVSANDTTISNGGGTKEAIDGRIEIIRGQLEDPEFAGAKESLIHRLAKLSSGFAILYVGAPSEIEAKEKMDRVDDALRATSAAVEEGIVAGGGVAFIRAMQSMVFNPNQMTADVATGIEIVKRAIEAPLRQICENGGVEGSIVVEKVKGMGDYFGYNAKTGEYVDLITAGVIDPTKVARVALENAASIATMLLITECVLSIEGSANSTSQ